GNGSRHRRRQLQSPAVEQLQPGHHSRRRGLGLMGAVSRRLLDVLVPRRKLKQGTASSGRGGATYGGYVVTSTNMAPSVVLDEADMAATVPARHVGATGAIIVAGLFLHQQRILPTALW
ncbi:hypothetical protein Vretifemale_3573, partial [Volvox reticuliferus]